MLDREFCHHLGGNVAEFTRTGLTPPLWPVPGAVEPHVGVGSSPVYVVVPVRGSVASNTSAKYRSPPCTSLDDRLDVPEAKSRASTSPTFRPRLAASSAAPAPTTPAPITRTSNCSSSRRRSATARYSGPSATAVIAIDYLLHIVRALRG